VVRIDNPDNSSQFQPMVQGATGSCYPTVNTADIVTPPTTYTGDLISNTVVDSVWHVLVVKCPTITGANHVMLDFHTGWESAMLSTPMNVYIDSVALLGDGTAVSATFGFDYPTTLTATGWQATGVFYNTAGSTLTGFAVTSVDTAP